MQLFITKKADEEQRQALIRIITGQAKVDGRKSRFSIPDGIIDVQLENFVNPVSGEEQDTKIQLPKGFIFKVADAAKTKIMRISTPNLNFDDSGKNAFYSVVEFKGP